MPEEVNAWWTGISSMTSERPQQPLGTARQSAASGWGTGWQPPVRYETAGTSALAPDWQTAAVPQAVPVPQAAPVPQTMPVQQAAPVPQTASQPSFGEGSPIDVPRSRFAAPPQASGYDPVWATSIFDEHDSPELMNVRSENLNNREGDFWKNPEHSAAQPKARGGKRKASARRRGLTALGILLGLLLVAATLFATAFRVRTITVEGNADIPAAEIIRMAGISQGQNTFSLDENLVSRRIGADRYLSFVCMEVTWPDKVVIRVRERQKAAYLRCNGILFTIDSRGMVLEETLDTDADVGNLVNVSGLQPKRCEVGREIIPGDPERMEIFRQAMVEAKVLSCLEDIRELNLADKENISLLTATGFSVRLGTSERLHAKLRSLLLTEAELVGRGYASGSIDVSSPEKPTYIP